MKIQIDRLKNEFYVHIKECHFTANPSGICVLFTKEELETLEAFAGYALQDSEMGNV